MAVQLGWQFAEKRPTELVSWKQGIGEKPQRRAIGLYEESLWMNHVASWLFGPQGIRSGVEAALVQSLWFDGQENGAFSALQEH
ncbi:MAG: hypothetical protein NPIRA03_04030 [Nitrospirales bacterium]|nr:MAG: hypothetical protein NPIRA03_04030 [Nitrospirales bacterium]